MSLYSDVVDAGVEVASFQSDLYFEKTPVSDKLVEVYRDRATITIFTDAVTKTPWYCAYFMYEPYWEKKKQAA